MNKVLINDGHMDALMKGNPVQVCGVTIAPNAEIQQQLLNVKVNGWKPHVDILFDQEDKGMEIRMKAEE